MFLKNYLQTLSVLFVLALFLALRLILLPFPWNRDPVLEESNRPKKLNVIFIIFDDLRPVLGVYGDRAALTPHLDQLGRQGTVFTHAYAQFGLCGPSRTSMLTSRLPQTTQCVHNGFNWKAVGNFTSLPEHFRSKGYDTMASGKIFHHMLGHKIGDASIGWTDGRFFPLGRNTRAEQVCPDGQGHLKNQVLCPVDTQQFPGTLFADREIRENVLDYLDKHRGGAKPFLASIGFYSPHAPMKFPQEYLGLHPLDEMPPIDHPHPPKGVADLNLTLGYWTKQYLKSWDWGRAIRDGNFSIDYQMKVRQHYYAALTFADHELGKILDFVFNSELKENTLIAVVGDHGYTLGEHGMFGKQTHFDTSVHVPWILHHPSTHTMSQFKLYSMEELQVLAQADNPKPDLRGHRVSAHVPLLNVYPTLVDLAGLDPMPSCPWQAASSRKTAFCTEGESMAHFVKGRKSLRKSDKEVYTQIGRQRSIDQAREQLDYMGYSVRDHSFLYVEWFQHRANTSAPGSLVARELYNRRLDPSESINQADRRSYAHVTNTLSNKLRSYFFSRL